MAPVGRGRSAAGVTAGEEFFLPKWKAIGPLPSALSCSRNIAAISSIPFCLRASAASGNSAEGGCVGPLAVVGVGAADARFFGLANEVFFDIAGEPSGAADEADTRDFFRIDSEPRRALLRPARRGVGVGEALRGLPQLSSVRTSAFSSSSSYSRISLRSLM